MLTHDDVEVVDTEASTGAGIDVINSHLHLTGASRVANNRATGPGGIGPGGGGITATSDASGPGTITLADTSAVEFNFTAGNGGGIYVENVTVTLTGRSSLHKNTADARGGECYLVSSSLTLHDHGALTENVANGGSGSGGGVSVDAGGSAQRIGDDVIVRLNDPEACAVGLAGGDCTNVVNSP